MTSPTETRFRIGQVCDELRAEFPDVSISKLRFLQDKGIVDPERTEGGYRIYTAEQVATLRQALHMQRDEFMPLRVIREELRRRLEQGGARPGSASSGDRRAGAMPAAGAVTLSEDEPLVTAEALVRAASVDHDFLEECRSAGIVTGQPGPGASLRYTPDEVGMVSRASELARAGIDVRHLRQAANAAARHGAIVEQFAATLLRIPGDEAHDRALRTVETVTAQLADFLRIAFIRDVKQTTARASSARASGRESSAPVASIASTRI